MTKVEGVPVAPIAAGARASSETGPGAALRVVLVYAAFACLWILLSDKVVAWLVRDPETMTLVSTAKGWLFVAVTSLLLFGLIRRLLSSLGHSLATLEQREVALRESAVLLQESQRIAGLGSYVLDIRAEAMSRSLLNAAG